MRLPRKNCTYIKNFLLIAGGLTILIVAFVCFSYKYKKIHLSIDDVSACMMHLTKDSLICGSIFEEPLFAQLQELHDKYGAKFTLYTYKKNDWYDIDMFPRKYRQDFLENKDWLTIRFHAETPSLSKNVIADHRRFKTAYMLTTSNLQQKCIGGVKR